ncbi:MAG: ATP phosphoribosyltransferase regulatory subunit [Oscillospiraceae bacterium]|nr:ATP phosphoribosyltransferase regulatory subunit [Oscillospiraceae bacterium]
MKKYNFVTPEGTRDLLFDECTARRKIENSLMELFKSEGYSEVITPFIEFYDVFENYYPLESMYKLTDSKGRLMVLRPDSTPPIIRLAETRLKDELRPLKLCYNQTIYRSNPKETGRDDEIAQCGIEIVGNTKGGKHHNKNVLKLAVEAFEKIGENYRFELGDCRIFNNLIRINNIDKKVEKDIRELTESKNYSELNKMEIPKALKELPKLFGGLEVFVKAEELLESDYLKELLIVLKNTYDSLKEFVKEDNITVDLGLIGKQGYYKGIIYNGYIEGFGKPVLEGGRYMVSDTLATGFAVNVSAVAEFREKK